MKLIKNLRKTIIHCKDGILKIKTCHSGQIRLSFFLAFIGYSIGTGFGFDFDLSKYQTSLSRYFYYAFDEYPIKKDTYKTLYGKVPTRKEFKQAYKDGKFVKKRIGKEFFEIIIFILAFAPPYFCLLMFFIYPKSQPIVFDRERKVLYTVVRKQLYIAQIPNYSFRANLPEDYFKYCPGVKLEASYIIHYSLEIHLCKSTDDDFRGLKKIFRCGSIPNDALLWPYGDAVCDFMYEYHMGLVDENDLAKSKNTRTPIDLIRWFFDHSWFFYRDRTRDAKVLAMVDEYIANHPNPYKEERIGIRFEGDEKYRHYMRDGAFEARERRFLDNYDEQSS